MSKLTEEQKKLASLAGVSITESLGEDNSSLDDASKAKSEVLDADSSVEGEVEKPEMTDRCKAIIRCITNDCLPKIQKELDHYVNVQHDDEERGLPEFHERVIDALNTMKAHIEDNGELGIKRAAHLLTSLMSPMQHEIPDELWELLTEKPETSLRSKYEEIDTKMFAENIGLDYNKMLIERTAEQDNARMRLTDEELEFAHDLVRKHELSMSEITELSHEFATDFGRTPGSLQFVLRRLHSLVHGKIPLDASYSPGWFNVPQTMVAWAKKKGIPVHDNMIRAEAEAKERQETADKKVDRKTAMEKMVSYYQSNKRSFTPRDKQSMVSKREDIITDIMGGKDPSEAFAAVLG